MMREYLCAFLEEYRYPLDASAVLLDAYDRIAANAEAREAWESALALYEADFCCDSGTLIAKADEAAERVGGILVALSGTEGDYKYVMTSRTADLSAVVKQANAALSGRGGGRGGMVQGTFLSTIEQIKAYFS